MPCHIQCEILQLIVRFPWEEREHIDIARIMGVTHGAFSKILERVWQTGFPNQGPLGHRQRISASWEDLY